MTADLWDSGRGCDRSHAVRGRGCRERLQGGRGKGAVISISLGSIHI